MSRIVVQHVITSLGTGGAERMLERIVRCSSDEVEHRVLTLLEGGGMVQPLVDAGARVQSLALRNTALAPLLRRIAAVEFKHRSSVQVFSGWLHHGNVAAAMLARAGSRKPLVLNFRSSVEHEYHRPVVKALRAASRCSDLRVTNSHECAVELRRLGFGEAEVVPNGFPLDAFRTNAFRWTRSSREVTVGTLGRFHPVKRQDVFVRGVSALMRRYPSIRGLVVGRGVQASLSSFVPSDLMSRWSFEEETTAVSDALARMNIFVQASESEGFPNAVAEAMLAGCAIAATDVGETRRLLGVGNVAFAPNDDEALARAVESLLAYDERALRFVGESNSAFIAARFDERTIARRFAEWFCLISQGAQ
jgi:glycosyltransferase involved in cell wall biosynthesis